VISAVGEQFGFTETRCGFLVFVPNSYIPGETTYIEVESDDGQLGFKGLKISARRGMGAIRRLLESVDIGYGQVDQVFDSALGPAIAAINVDRLEVPCVADEIQFGTAPAEPRFSVVVPLYGRIDFVEYQMGLFSRDESMRNAEIIYVLDDPPKRRELERLAQSIFARFEIPFRLLLLPRNLGFAPANNFGLRAARGKFLCFLNSDAFPGTANWLERLAQQLEANPDIGAIGPRLLFEDGSVQHEGCVYRPIEEFSNWMFLDHPNKGRRPTEGKGLQRYEVITGACMLLDRQFAEELGGFDESFIIGDFEDADLCLKIRERGLDCVVDFDVQLYHLERKSQTAPGQLWRFNLTLYNAWVHQRRWFPDAGMVDETPLAPAAVEGGN
jgi:GT2 family glycosyltransferase